LAYPENEQTLGSLGNRLGLVANASFLAMR